MVQVDRRGGQTEAFIGADGVPTGSAGVGAEWPERNGVHGWSKGFFSVSSGTWATVPCYRHGIPLPTPPPSPRRFTVRQDSSPCVRQLLDACMHLVVVGWSRRPGWGFDGVQTPRHPPPLFALTWLGGILRTAWCARHTGRKESNRIESAARASERGGDRYRKQVKVAHSAIHRTAQ